MNINLDLSNTLHARLIAALPHLDLSMYDINTIAAVSGGVEFNGSLATTVDLDLFLRVCESIGFDGVSAYVADLEDEGCALHILMEDTEVEWIVENGKLEHFNHDLSKETYALADKFISHIV